MALSDNPHVRHRRLTLRAGSPADLVFVVETDLVLDAAAEGYDATAIEILNREIAEELRDLKVDKIEIVPFVS